MKTSLVVLSLCLLGVGLVIADDDGPGARCERQKHTCGHLCHEPEGSHEDSHETPSAPEPTKAVPTKGAPAPTGNPTVGPWVPTPAPGQCVCTPPEGSGSGSHEGSGSSHEGSGSSHEGSGGSGHHFHSHCELIEWFYNVSIILTVEEQTIFIEWIQIIENTILIDITLTDEQKFIKVALEYKRFCDIHYEIAIQINFELIITESGSWGYGADLYNVAIDVSVDIVGGFLILDDNDDCELFDAIRNETELIGDAQFSADVEILIKEIRQEILLVGSLSIEVKYDLIYRKFEALFVKYEKYRARFYKIKLSVDIDFELFFTGVCLTYHRIATVSVVVGGSTSECVLLQSLQEAFENTSFSLSVRSQIQQLKQKLEAYFEVETSVELRLQFVASCSFEFFKLELFIVKECGQISLGVWGSFWDLYFCGGFYISHPGQFESSTPAVEVTTEAVTTVAPTTKATTGCPARPSLIVIDGSNATCLTTSVNVAYNSWSRTDKANFLSYKKRIESAIYSNTEFSTSEAKLQQITTVFTGYAPAGSTASVQVMSIQIVCQGTTWGKVQDFCDCQK